ncbi:MAG: hypothetical protein IJI47_04825 [Eubacterium sp.]|nr:hypothetical protein [Eubacterium sp.]MBR0412869.1 hypothetical protein [Eubacterium sp.]
MKKLLIFVLSALLLLTASAGCANDKKGSEEASTTEATTLDKSDSDIKQGKLRGDTYINKSLGIRVYVPSGYTRQDFGELVLNPDNTEPETHEYYLAKGGKKAKAIFIDIENTNLASTDAWVKSFEEAKTEKAATIGSKEFSAVSVTNEKMKTTKLIFGYVDKDRLCTINFENIGYDEAMKIISDYFETE